MIGWVAVTGSFSWDSVILFSIIFLWTPPHFWALALYKQGDYAKVGIPMLPNVKGARVTRNQIMIYSILLVGVSLLPLLTGLGGWIYGIVASGLGLGFLGLAFRVYRSRAGAQYEDEAASSLYAVEAGNRVARNLFAFSIVYLLSLIHI